MPPSEAELLAARLTRMNNLIDSLQSACAQSAENHEVFLKLKQEMVAARQELGLIMYPPPGSSPTRDKGRRDAADSKGSTDARGGTERC
jgi:hypothetical protein